jgi:hypothetical protein
VRISVAHLAAWIFFNSLIFNNFPQIMKIVPKKKKCHLFQNGPTLIEMRNLGVMEVGYVYVVAKIILIFRLLWPFEIVLNYRSEISLLV